MPWPKNTRYLGKNTPRVEAPAKLSGRAKYTSDVAPAGVLYGAIVRSKLPAAHVRSVDLTKVKAAPGIRAAILANDGEFDVRYYGQEIAAIAGTSKQAVLDALELVTMDAEARPFVVNELDAVKADAPRVFADKPNLGEGAEKHEGDVDAAFASSAAVVEAEFHTSIQLHQTMEPHGNLVQWEGEDLNAWCSTQAVFICRESLAGALRVPQNRVRVVCEHMGGGFGSKFWVGQEGLLCARLAKAAGAPVKLMLTRFEEALAVGNRPSSYQKIKLAGNKDGTLTAFEMHSFGTPGYESGMDQGGGSGGAGFPSPYIYKPATTRVKQGSVAVNAGQSCAMRAPGHPVASVGMEGILDELAVKLEIDPVEMRIKNDPFEVRRREYELGAERFGWKQKYRKPGTSPGPIKTGVGCGGAAWMSGGEGTQAEIQINRDGTVEVKVGTQDLGTGSRTVVQVVAAEMLGIERELVAATIGDTRFPPSGASGGSQTTASVSPAVYDCCEKALAELKQASGMEDVSGANWKQACGKLRAPLQVRGKWRPGLSTGGAGGVQFAEVEVDTETGFVKLKKMLVVQDCGLVVNKLTCESQINGGVIMGIGYALYEQRVMDARTGVVLNASLETYKVPGAADMPDIEIMLLDMPERGVIGVGEPCTVPTAAAIANAVSNALGVRMGDLPITPDKVLAALGKLPKRDTAATAEHLDGAFAKLAAVPSTAWVEPQSECHA
ncbi:xanthine dehydrogenase family protein molybdopterin-binding subunit [Opitutus terrae]|uniref:Aldehyde oxidase and xanthine dehydrogenase molybdopterin binding n=1 Tax=Opitutus terrae (strain DSM 11246 / JCM 15787 / PB90-1) TaxID=452637 RepID=B1ZT14_OPITP|nr:xanthine dehydrogenase family protein molybdopterin-binding subunit [Opitutus terrae]ACB75803.1 aldehyde oxidase and xanthine dehydrogenase molybdopterin binding [Opitutus terrae PB90-1]